MTAFHFEPRCASFRSRVEDSFRKQGAMVTLGARLAAIAPGAVDIELDWAAGLTQQHGFLHAGIVSTALDAVCAYSALTMMPADAAVLTIEFKVNLLAPGKGDHFLFRGNVTKQGRTIMVSDGQAFAVGETEVKLVATMTATLMVVKDREDLQD